MRNQRHCLMYARALSEPKANTFFNTTDSAALETIYTNIAANISYCSN